MENDVLWVRLGDDGDYESFEDLDQVADCLAEAGVHFFERDGPRYGIEAAGFEGYNYISLYWGPDPGNGSAEASRDLTDQELFELQIALDERMEWATQ